MLDTTFPRIHGDAGNTSSYPYRAEIAVVSGAGAAAIVRPGHPRRDLLPAFKQAAKDLQAAGAVGLISTCGFLIHFQDEIAQAVDVPVMVSALSLFDTVRIATGGRPVGILTASATSLLDGGLQAAGIDGRAVHVAGLEDCAAFCDPILLGRDQPSLDVAKIEASVVARAKALLVRHTQIGAFLLECGNLPPYAPAIRAATGKPVFSILDAARMLWEASECQLL
ncbi:MAG: aspartate/glutamate racemase family protein [Pseudomonadota bacterium]